MREFNKVFGVGMSKTGTTTLAECFEILGLTPHKGFDPKLKRLHRDGRGVEAILRTAEGYRTFAVATSIRFHESSGFAQGFEHYESLHERPKNARAALATDLVLELARSDDSRPFFGFVHYFGPHTPYAPPEPWRSRWHEGPAPELPGP